jgi:hypothetical protein
MLTSLVGFFAKSALMRSPIGAVLKRIPKQVWIAVAIALALAAAFVWHQHKAHSALKSADAAGYARAMKDVEARALKLKAKVDKLTAKISAEERTKNDVENRRIASAADALRLRGPGKALCTVPAGAPGASSGHFDASGPGDASVSGVLDPQRVALVGLPVSSAVGFAEQHDVLRAEVISWREWYRRLQEAWPKL